MPSYAPRLSPLVPEPEQPLGQLPQPVAAAAITVQQQAQQPAGIANTAATKTIITIITPTATAVATLMAATDIN